MSLRLAVSRLIKPLRFLTTKTTRSVFLSCYAAKIILISYPFVFCLHIYIHLCVYCCLFICKIIILFFKFECKSINIKSRFRSRYFLCLQFRVDVSTTNTFLQGLNRSNVYVWMTYMYCLFRGMKTKFDIENKKKTTKKKENCLSFSCSSSYRNRRSTLSGFLSGCLSTKNMRCKENEERTRGKMFAFI